MEFKDLLDIVRKRWWIVAIATLLITSVVAVVNYFVLENVYSSNITIYVGRNTENQNNVLYNDLLISAQLVKDYRELVMSRSVAEAVIEELKLEHITSTQVSRKLGVSLVGETRFIQISAEDKDPDMAMRLANAAGTQVKQRATEFMKVDNVQIIDKAIVNPAPIKPRKQLNVLFSFFVGLVIGVGVVVLIEYLDNTIKTPDDVEKYLGVPTIGTIPLFEELT
ncbi:MAG: lipopolysaccharide biosynthesis protein [Hyphomonadaceae bacterium]|nr:lipopolysaccharide biosynthesis protein [Clostridia bacterium]